MAASQFSQSSAAVSNHLEDFSSNDNHVEEDGERSVCSSNSVDNSNNNARDFSETATSSYVAMTTTTSMAYLPHNLVLCEFRHDGFEECIPSGPSDSGMVSKWRPRDRTAAEYQKRKDKFFKELEIVFSDVVALSGTSFSLLQRVGAIMRNEAKLIAVGTTSSLVGTVATNTFISARKAVEHSAEDEIETVLVLSTSRVLI